MMTCSMRSTATWMASALVFWILIEPATTLLSNKTTSSGGATASSYSSLRGCWPQSQVSQQETAIASNRQTILRWSINSKEGTQPWPLAAPCKSIHSCSQNQYSSLLLMMAARPLHICQVLTMRIPQMLPFQPIQWKPLAERVRILSVQSNIQESWAINNKCSSCSNNCSDVMFTFLSLHLILLSIYIYFSQ